MKRGHAVRWSLLGLMGVLVLLPAWLLATESGLYLVLRGAERATGGRLSFGEGSGRLIDTFGVRDIVYETERVSVRIGQASLNLRLTRLLAGRLQAESLDVQHLAIATRDGGDAATDKPPLTVSTGLRLAVEHGVLRDFRLQRGGAQEWRLPQAQFTARWRGEWITISHLQAETAELGAIEVRGRLAVVEGRLNFEDFAVRSAHANLRLDGALGLGAAPSELQVAWDNLRLPNAAWFSSAQGAARLSGPWRDYRWTVEGAATAYETDGQVRARGTGDLDGVVLEGAVLQTLGGSIDARGRFDWRGGLSTELALNWQALDPAQRFAQWPGRLTGSGRFRGSFSASTPRLEFQARLVDSALRGYPLALEANGITEDRQVLLDKFLLQSGPSTLKASGQLLPQFALEGSLVSDDLQSLWSGLQGRVQLQARLRGNREAPRLQLSGSGSELVYRGLRAARAALSAQVAPRGRSTLNLELTDVDARASLRSVRLTAAGNADAHRIDLAAQGATAAGAVALEGRYRNGAWRGALTGAGFTPDAGRGFALTEPAPVTFRNGRLGVDPACLADGDSRACVQAQISAARQYVALRTERFEIKHLQALLPAEWTMSGTLSGTAAVTVLRGELHDLRADLHGSAGSLSAAGLQLDYGPGELRVQSAGEQLRAQLHLTPAGGAVSGDLTLGAAATLLDRPMQGELTINMPDLSWLPVLSPELAAAEGALTGALRVGGTPRSPALDGRIALAGGRVQLTTPGIEFTNIAAAFESSARAALAVTVTADAGEGKLRLEGTLQALRPQLAGEFALTGDNAQFFNTAELRAYVAPDLKLAFAEGTARLTGELKVSGALITPRQIGGGGIAPSGDQVLVSADGEAEAGGLAIETEVRIVLGDAVRFDGLGLKTRLTGAITAYDNPGRPTRARGEFQLVGGRYKAYGQELLIESGRLLFTGGPVTDPAIDITAYREPREDIRVGLQVRGKLEAPQFNLYSTPAMSQEEQLSWLMLGRSLEESLAGGAGGEISGAAVSLGLSGGDFLAQQLGTRLGFDEVSVGAKPGEAADQARFTIGKYLSPRLFVSYGVGLFQPGNYFRMQYDLGKGFKLSGESGVTSGGDVLYSIER